MAIDKKKEVYHNYRQHTMDNESQKTTVPYAVIAIVVALGLLGVVVLTVTVIIPLQQQAEARGCKSSVPFNASKGRCFQP
jgi:Flp pilus assembly pilin Flp